MGFDSVLVGMDWIGLDGLEATEVELHRTVAHLKHAVRQPHEALNRVLWWADVGEARKRKAIKCRPSAGRGKGSSKKGIRRMQATARQMVQAPAPSGAR